MMLQNKMLSKLESMSIKDINHANHLMYEWLISLYPKTDLQLEDVSVEYDDLWIAPDKNIGINFKPTFIAKFKKHYPEVLV